MRNISLFYSRDLCDPDSCGEARDDCHADDLDQSVFTKICKYAVMALASMNILREVIQILNSRMNYLSWENLVEWIAYICSLLLVIDWSSCQVENPGYREKWQWQIGAVAILLAWLELVVFIRKIPRFGIFVVLFTDIFWTFLQFLPVFSVLPLHHRLCPHLLCALWQPGPVRNCGVVAAFDVRDDDWIAGVHDSVLR